MITYVRPRLVTFDVTGTLLMTQLKYYAEIGRQHGLLIDQQKLARSFRMSLNKLSIEHPIYGKHTGIGWQNWWRRLVHDVFKDQHDYISDTTLDKVSSTLIKSYGTSLCWHKYPGTIEILEYLQKKGLIIGVISNFDERLEAILLDTKIRSYFSFVLTSYAFGVEKPDTKIFDEALKLTRKYHNISIASQEAIHIGDSEIYDYLGAKNANWNAILIKHDDNTKIKKALPKEDFCTNLQELQQLLSKRLSKEIKCNMHEK